MALKGYYKALANIKKREGVKGLISDIGTLAVMGHSAIKDSKTAWGEYEKGYKEVTGEDIDTSRKFGQKGWLKRTFGAPKGEIEIEGFEGDVEGAPEGYEHQFYKTKTYDMENIRKLGSIISSDAGQVLDDDMIDRITKRIAPGSEWETKKYETSKPTWPSEFKHGLDIDHSVDTSIPGELSSDETLNIQENIFKSRRDDLSKLHKPEYSAETLFNIKDKAITSMEDRVRLLRGEYVDSLDEYSFNDEVKPDNITGYFQSDELDDWDDERDNMGQIESSAYANRLPFQIKEQQISAMDTFLQDTNNRRLYGPSITKEGGSVLGSAITQEMVNKYPKQPNVPIPESGFNIEGHEYDFIGPPEAEPGFDTFEDWKEPPLEWLSDEPAGINYETNPKLDPLESIDAKQSINESKTPIIEQVQKPLMETKASKYKRLNWRPDDTFKEKDLLEAQGLGWGGKVWV